MVDGKQYVLVGGGRYAVRLQPVLTVTDVGPFTRPA